MSDSLFENHTRDISARSAALSLLGNNLGLHDNGFRASTSAQRTTTEDPINYYAQGDSATSAHTHVLVTALENFMLPIIYAYVPAFGNRAQNVYNGSRDTYHPQLRPEAQKLLFALEEFISALIRPSLGGNGRAEDTQGTAEHLKEMFPPNNRNSAELNSVARSVRRNVAFNPPLLKLALEEARHPVFNKMPIRLLAFYSNGSEMELVERSTIWDRISERMVTNFNDDVMQHNIRGFMKTHHSQSEAEQQAVEDFVSENTRYAVLSHTWLHETPGEVTYANWMSGEFDRGSAGYRKLTNFCRVAGMDYRVSLGWMDTICINKESSAELDESIRSMCKWYRDAYICVTYLANTTFLPNMHDDPWFTRGWTLQELLAPRYIKFYSGNWAKINPGLEDLPMESDTRHPLIQHEIRTATTIAPYEFNLFQSSPQSIRISRRMQWAANRRVTREEDTAYSLMGIFDVSIPIAYGEGSERAFSRLVKEILTSTNEDLLDIVNWAAGPELQAVRSHTSSASATSLIPSSPKRYLWRAEKSVHWFPLTKPITLTHLGLHLPVLLMRAVSTYPQSPYRAPDSTFIPCGNYYANVSIDALNPNSIRYKLPQRYNVLETPDYLTAPNKDGWIDNKTRFQLIFGVLNFHETENSIELSDNFSCLAVCLYFSSQNSVKRIATSQAIVFDLKQLVKPPLGQNTAEIPKTELEKHGMRLLTMYL